MVACCGSGHGRSRFSKSRRTDVRRLLLKHFCCVLHARTRSQRRAAALPTSLQAGLQRRPGTHWRAQSSQGLFSPNIARLARRYLDRHRLHLYRCFAHLDSHSVYLDNHLAYLNRHSPWESVTSAMLPGGGCFRLPTRALCSCGAPVLLTRLASYKDT